MRSWAERPQRSGRSPGVFSGAAAQSGQGLVEYALILVIVSIVTIFLIVAMGSRLNGMFSNVVNALGS